MNSQVETEVELRYLQKFPLLTVNFMTKDVYQPREDGELFFLVPFSQKEKGAL